MKFYIYRFGNYFGNFYFVWKIEDDDVIGDLEVILSIKEYLFVYVIRVMRNEFMNCYLKIGIKFVILWDMYRFLICDVSVVVLSGERVVDDRVLEFFL